MIKFVTSDNLSSHIYYNDWALDELYHTFQFLCISKIMKFLEVQ
jgi:hypothetical protein